VKTVSKGVRVRVGGNKKLQLYIFHYTYTIINTSTNSHFDTCVKINFIYIRKKKNRN